MLLDLAPLRKHRDFRLLFVGQMVSLFGNMLTYVAVPYQIFQLTHSSKMVGSLAAAQLVPLLVFALFGGTVADAIDRRRLLLVAEAVLAVGSVVLALNASLAQPRVEILFAVAVLMSAVTGFHRPALDAMTPRLVDVEDLASISALGSLRRETAAILGPTLAGLLIAKFGLTAVYVLDVVTFVVSLVAIAMMRPPPPIANAPRPGLGAILDGLRYAKSRPELVGTYLVDLAAMTLSMPMALFPSLAEGWGGAKAAGWLYAAISIGSLGITLMSGWTSRVDRRGAAVIWAAAGWGVAIVAFGFARSLPVAVACLALAGAADMISALFRGVIWNETIPAELRGRLASVEMLSYMTGPLIGNLRAGYMASVVGNQSAIVWGGVACVAAVLACIPLLPAFYWYRRPVKAATPNNPVRSEPVEKRN